MRVWQAVRRVSIRAPLAPDTVAVFGDSHTNIAPGYPERLAELLGVPVRRDSYGGRSAAAALFEIPGSPLRHAAASVLLIGTNDIGNGADASTVQSRIAACLALVPGPARPVCIPPRGRSRGWTPEKEAVRLAVNAWILETYPLATEVDSVLGDGSGALRFHAGDWLHLSAEGFERLAVAVAASFR